MIPKKNLKMDRDPQYKKCDGSYDRSSKDKLGWKILK